MIDPDDLEKMSWEQVLNDDSNQALAQSLYMLMQEAQGDLGIASDFYSEDVEPEWIKFAEKLRANLTLRL
jgi:hypothetical protein